MASSCPMMGTFLVEWLGKARQHDCRRVVFGFGATSVVYGTIWDSSVLCVALAMALLVPVTGGAALPGPLLSVVVSLL